MMNAAIVKVQESQVMEVQVLNVDALNDFVQWLDMGSATSIKSYGSALKQMFQYFMERGITTPQPSDLRTWDADIRARLAPATVQKYTSAARRFFQWTADAGIYPNIAAGHKTKAKQDTRVFHKDFLSKSDIAAILCSIPRHDLKSKRDFALVMLMASTGIRTISASLANVGDIVRKDGKHYLQYQGKGHHQKDRLIMLDDSTVAFVMDYLRARGDLDENDSPRNDEAPLFQSTSRRMVNASDKRLPAGMISRIVKAILCGFELVDAAGHVTRPYDSKRLTAHSLRHTAANIAFDEGKSAFDVQQLLDHHSMDTTQRYLRMRDQLSNDSAAAVSSAIFDAMTARGFQAAV